MDSGFLSPSECQASLMWPGNLCPSRRLLIPVLITSADEAGSGLGRGASEFGEVLGAALPEAQRPWERQLGVFGLQTRVARVDCQPRGGAVPWGSEECSLGQRA